MQAVYDIGDPGLWFGPREMRLSHGSPALFGWGKFWEKGVQAADGGRGRVEKPLIPACDSMSGQPLELS